MRDDFSYGSLSRPFHYIHVSEIKKVLGTPQIDSIGDFKIYMGKVKGKNQYVMHIPFCDASQFCDTSQSYLSYPDANQINRFIGQKGIMKAYDIEWEGCSDVAITVAQENYKEFFKIIIREFLSNPN